MAPKKKRVKKMKQNATPENGDKSTTTPPDDTPTGTSFLDLPAEIRNYIYELAVIKSPVARLRPPRRHHWFKPHILSIDSPLVYVNKQVSAEYLSVARAITPHISTSVHDFNFDHVLAFLDHVSDPATKHAEFIPKDQPLHHVWILISTMEAAMSDVEAGKNTCFRNFVQRLAKRTEVEHRVRLMFHWRPEHPGVRFTDILDNNDICFGHKEEIEGYKLRICDHENSTNCLKMREQIPLMVSRCPPSDPDHPWNGYPWQAL